jgi:hypothetical protein
MKNELILWAIVGAALLWGASRSNGSMAQVSNGVFVGETTRPLLYDPVTNALAPSTVTPRTFGETLTALNPFNLLNPLTTPLRRFYAWPFR